MRFLAVFFGLLSVGPAWPANPSEPGQVNLVKAADHVDFKIGDSLVGRYHLALPESNVAKPYLWPLNGPTGTPITRGWPMVPKQAGESDDHPHQKSVWFCHGDVIPEGMELKHRIKGVEGVDFWSEGKGHGRIVCTKSEVDAKHGRLITHNEWRTADGQKVLDEVRTITLRPFGDTRLLLFDIGLCASVVPVTFGDTKEGSFGIRINDKIREAGGHGKLENAEGKVTEARCWGQRSAWCDYSGPIDGTVVGLAILDDPNNAQPACWHSRGYGLMAANPFGRDRSGFPAMKGKAELVRLDKGQHLKLRYGLLIHPGDAHEGKVAEHFERFVRVKE
jgi:hypothetical protein